MTGFGVYHTLLYRDDKGITILVIFDLYAEWNKALIRLLYGLLCGVSGQVQGVRVRGFRV